MKSKKQQNKQQLLEQQAWKWAEVTDVSNISEDHIQVAYMLSTPPCKPHHCRRNCKYISRCVNALGEGKWHQTIKDDHWYDIADPEKEIRATDSFAGLKNLGATCYINTFLQVWFHIVYIRKSIFNLQEPGLEETTLLSRPLSDLRELLGAEELEKLLEPRSVSSHLQTVFALLKHSDRRYIDPTPFINSLGIDAALQQDAQEFSKLFMCLLESTLQQQNNPERNFIRKLFQGRYKYMTQCAGCKAESQNLSEFYELDLNIKGHKTLQDCVHEFLKEEKLEGDNQYACSACGMKQNATRSIKLESLPPVLNVQLLRFVYDRKSGTKKKLNTFIEFNEELDMSAYMGKPEGKEVYYLKAVLIHKGPSAYSGHYIALIRDHKSRDWYKFNDEVIERVAGKKLELGIEDEIDGLGVGSSKAAKRPKTSKGFHASRNAYMLVYEAKNYADDPNAVEVVGTSTDRTSPTPTTSNSKGTKRASLKAELLQDESLDNLPLKIRRFIEFDNSKFENWRKEIQQLRENSLTCGRVRLETAKQIFEKLPCKIGDEYEWLPTSWLIDFFNAKTAADIPAINNKPLMCPHQKLDPDKVVQAKCISKEVAQELFSLYKGEPRFDRSSLCETCVSARVRVIHMRARIAEDHKEIEAFLKTKETPDDMTDWFWVGKLSLRSWKRFALELLQKLVEETRTLAINDTQIDDKESGTNCDHAEKNNENDASYTSEGKNTEDQASRNNTSVLEMSSNADQNNASHSNGVTPKEEDNSDKLSVSSVSNQTGLSFNEDAQCIPHDNLVIEEGVRRLVPPELWQRLRRYFPEAPKYRADTPPCLKCTAEVEEERRLQEQNKVLASEQKAALLNLYQDRARPTWQQEYTQLYLVTKRFLDDWRRFIKGMGREQPPNVVNKDLLCTHGCFPHDPAIVNFDDKIHFVTPDEWDILRKGLFVDHEVSVSRIAEESGHVTFITSPDVCTECQESNQLNPSNFQSGLIYVRKLDENGTTDAAAASKSDSNFEPRVVQSTGKRKLETENQCDKFPRLEESDCLRRSTRRRRCAGEKQISVSSADTLRDFKIKVMKLFSVAPFDQTLFRNGEPLSGDQSTLSSLGVQPGDTLYLKEDEPVEDPTFLDDPGVNMLTEEGFKGTGLLGQ